VKKFVQVRFGYRKKVPKTGLENWVAENG